MSLMVLAVDDGQSMEVRMAGGYRPQADTPFGVDRAVSNQEALSTTTA